jgi:TolA-binding protein
VKAQHIIDGFAQLARDATGDELTPREQAGLERLEAALAVRRTPRRGRWTLPALGFAAVAGAAAGVFFFVHQRPLTFEVTHGRVSEGGYIVSESPEAEVLFSDRSDLGMEPGTRLRVSHLEVRGARMMLEGGLLHVHIRPRPQASWAIDAGPYVVHVTGTEFDLGWNVDAQTLDLHLRKGSVTVEGPLANGGIRMEAGQHLVANASDESLSIVDEHAPKASLDVAPAAAEPELGTANGHDPASGPTASPAGPGAARSHAASGAAAREVGRGAAANDSAWSARVARGDFDAVLASAEKRGLDRALAEAPLSDLGALADAARYAHRAEVARRALAAQRTRFPSSLQARDAAFFLGGLDETQGDEAGALDWYGTYLRESPSGAYASQALGRKMMLVQRLRGSGEARAIANDYVDRFPNGPYAPNAHALLQMK